MGLKYKQNVSFNEVSRPINCFMVASCLMLGLVPSRKPVFHLIGKQPPFQ